MPGDTLLHICRKGDGRNDPNGLYFHEVSVDVDGVEPAAPQGDTPTTIPCTTENEVSEHNPPLPTGSVNAAHVQVKQVVGECRNGTRHVVTWDLTKNPRQEIGDKDTGEACTASA